MLIWNQAFRIGLFILPKALPVDENFFICDWPSIYSRNRADTDVNQSINQHKWYCVCSNERTLCLCVYTLVDSQHKLLRNLHWRLPTERVGPTVELRSHLPQRLPHPMAWVGNSILAIYNNSSGTILIQLSIDVSSGVNCVGRRFRCCFRSLFYLYNNINNDNYNNNHNQICITRHDKQSIV